MNVLELKGSIHEAVAKMTDEMLLVQLYELINEMSDENKEKIYGEDLLTAEQKVELEIAIQESENPDNLVSFETFVKNHERW